MDTSATGRIVKQLSGSPPRWVANLGAAQGVRSGDEFVVFELGEEIIDPEDGANLGALELVKARLLVQHAQERLSILILKPGDDAPKAQPRRVLSAVLADTKIAKRDDGRAHEPKTPNIEIGDHVRRAGP